MSQLPDWMRNPEPPERTTLSWEIGQSMRRTRLWRLCSRWRVRLANRYRITARFPKTTAMFAWVLAFAVTVAIYYLVLLLIAIAQRV